MSKKRTLVILILVVGILLSLVGGAAARQEKPKFFLIAHGGPGNVFWVTVMKGMADAAAFLDVDATWLGADTASNEAMVGFWDDALAADPDGIGTTEPVPALIEDAVKRAAAAGIPVIAFNTQDTRPEGERLPHWFYIGTSEFIAGQACRVLGCDAAAIMSLDKPTQTLSVQAHCSLPDWVARQMRFRVGEAGAGRAVELRRSVVMADTLSHVRPATMGSCMAVKASLTMARSFSNRSTWLRTEIRSFDALPLKRRACSAASV